MNRRQAWFDKDAPDMMKRYGGHIHVGTGPEGQEPNSVLSLTDDLGRDATGQETALHMPLLDDDGGYFRVTSSSTPGHQHVFIDKAITWDQWTRLLAILGECALVDPKWAEASIAQGTATLRLPSNRKELAVVPPEVVQL